MMGAGICVVGVGLLVGLSHGNLKVELVYLVAGLLFFFAGQLLASRSK